MFERAPGDQWRKFATMRAFYAFMWSHPGKQLLFMGTEFGQRREFSEQRGVDWEESGNWGHCGVQRLVKDLNAIYREHPALHWLDNDPAGFTWIDPDARGENVFSYLRYDGEEMIACLVNFSARPRPDRRIGLPKEGVWKRSSTPTPPTTTGAVSSGTSARWWRNRCHRTGIRYRHWSLSPAGSGVAAVRARTCRGAA